MRVLVRLLSLKQATLASASVVLMLMVIGSGLLGLIRLRILNSLFTPEETGIFFAAFRIPNMLFELLVMGSLSAAFIPVFTKYLHKSGSGDATRIASSIITLTVVALAALTIPLFIFAEAVSDFFAPGYSSAEIAVMARYTRMMLVFQVMPLVVGNFFTGILQSYRMYLVPALAPILYNIGMIAGVIFFSRTMGISSAPLGVGIGAFLFFLIQLPFIYYLKHNLKPVWDSHHPGVREIFKLMLPRMLGLGVSQIDTTIDLMLATLLGPKMVTVFYLAQSLQQLPVRLFGTTVSQASLPILSSATAEDNMDKFRTSLLSAYTLMLFFVVPATVFFLVLRMPLVRLVYGAAKFDWEATVLTAMTVSVFSLSLPFQSVSQVFTRGFYALYDTKTPLIIAVLSISINSLLSIILIKYYSLPIYALGISASVAGTVQATSLGWCLYRKVHGFSLEELLIKPLKIAGVSFISGVIMFIPYKLFDQLLFDTTRVLGLILLTVLVSVLGFVSYAFLSWVFDISEVATLVALWNRIKKIKSFLVELLPSFDQQEVPDQ
jgi:putative peptidoglycan lipid II flippase